MPNNPTDYLQQGERANQRITQHEKECAERYERYATEIAKMNGDIKNMGTRIDHIEDKVNSIGNWIKGIGVVVTLFLTLITVFVGMIAL